MKERICYRLDLLLALLGGAKIQNIHTVKSGEEYSDTSVASYIVLRDDIVSIQNYYSLWTSQTVVFADGSEIVMRSNNVNSDDESIVRINNNKILSPRLEISDNYVGASKDLDEWLGHLGITKEELLAISKKFEIFETIEYIGVPTPSKLGSCWAYSSENLKLDEREINNVLNSIEDEVLREKIKVILYARVFKRGY